jgi:hypothetical protein
MDHKLDLKVKLASLISEEMEMCKLRPDNRDAYIVILGSALVALDPILDLIEMDVNAVKDQKKLDLYGEQKKAIIKETQEMFPEYKMDKMSFFYENEGRWWTDDCCEYCYSRDSSGHCDDEDHGAPYEEELIIRDADQKVIYHHTLQDAPDCFDHSSEKVYINPNLDKSGCFELLIFDWKRVATSAEEFSEWVWRVHKTVYNLHLKNDDGGNGFPKHYMRRMVADGIKSMEKETISPVSSGTKKRKL